MRSRQRHQTTALGINVLRCSKQTLNLVQDDNASSNMLTHVWHTGEQVASREGSTSQYLHIDHLGSVAAASDSSGNLAWERREYPFGGNRVDDAGGAASERFFTGQIEDADAGLYFYNARYLETGIGRFISPDSISLP